MSKRRKYVDYVRGIHVTQNLRNGILRFTFHFPNGVVFHSCKHRYTLEELKTISKPGYALQQHLRESYSVKP